MKLLSESTLDENTHRTIDHFVGLARLVYPIDRVVLFGSRAKNLSTMSSDADVMLLIKGHHGDFIATKLALADLAFDVLVETGIRIDPLPIWQDQWADPSIFSNPSLLSNIEREGVLIPW